MKRRGFFSSFVLSVLFAASGCSASDGTPTYRYRLTVEVDTPEGSKSGSSVIEVRQRMMRAAANPGSLMVERRIRGEAVAVDLPDGRTLFALLRSEDSVDWASTVMHNVAPKIAGEPYEERHDNMLLLKGPVTLPRQWGPFAGGLVMSAYPMLVTFGDLDDPTSVARVDPDDLAASFGEGTTLKSITVQMTDDPVTTGIEKRLRWLDDLKAYRTDPSNPFTNTLPQEIGGLRSQ